MATIRVNDTKRKSRTRHLAKNRKRRYNRKNFVRRVPPPGRKRLGKIHCATCRKTITDRDDPSYHGRCRVCYGKWEALAFPEKATKPVRAKK